VAFSSGHPRCLRLLILLSPLVSGAVALAQNAAAPAVYDPRITFAPLTLPDPVNAYRSSK